MFERFTDLIYVEHIVGYIASQFAGLLTLGDIDISHGHGEWPNFVGRYYGFPLTREVLELAA
jgi:hypothetical protein